MRVAEHDGGAAGEAAAQALEPAGRRPRVVHHPDARAVRLHHPLRRQRAPQLRVVDVAVHGEDRRPERLELREDPGLQHVAAVQDEVGGAQALHARLGQPPAAARQVGVGDDGQAHGAPDATAPRRARARAARALARRATTVRSAARERRTWRRRTVRAGRARPSALTSPESQRWRRSRRATPYQL